MRSLISNFRYSTRMLRKNPGLTAAVVATLMLGIGATTAIYTGGLCRFAGALALSGCKSTGHGLVEDRRTQQRNIGW